MPKKYKLMNGKLALAELLHKDNLKEDRFYNECNNMIKSSRKEKSKFKNLRNLTEFSFECIDRNLDCGRPNIPIYLGFKGDIIRNKAEGDKKLSNYIKDTLKMIMPRLEKFEIINIRFVFQVGEYGKLEILFEKKYEKYKKEENVIYRVPSYSKLGELIKRVEDDKKEIKELLGEYNWYKPHTHGKFWHVYERGSQENPLDGPYPITHHSPGKGITLEEVLEIKED